MSGNKPNLRVAMPGDVQHVEMADAIMALAQQCIAAQPAAVFIAWEANSRPGHFDVKQVSVPDSEVFRRGMVAFIHAMNQPVVE